METKRICKNVSWDGESFFCMRCFKAGFKTKAQAVGHQAQCPANEINLGSPPPTTTSTTTTPPYSTILPPLSTSSPPQDTERQFIIFGQLLAEIKQDQAKLANETTHALAVKNQNPFSNVDWGKVIAWGIGIAVISFLIGRETKVCYCGVETPRSGLPRGKSLGNSVASKVTDKAINYGLNKLLNRL